MSVLKTWISLIVLLSVVLIGCGKEPTCTDGIQNQGETGIDCCAASSNCSICPVCVLNPEDTMTTPDPVDTMMTTDDPRITAKVNGEDWTSATVTATLAEIGTLNFSGAGQNDSQISFVYSGDLVPGTYDFIGNIGSYSTGGLVYIADGTQGGGLVFSTLDTVSKTIEGTFSFTATNQADNTDTLQITDGVFTDIVYE